MSKLGLQASVMALERERQAEVERSVPLRDRVRPLRRAPAPLVSEEQLGRERYMQRLEGESGRARR
jgi:hypothetical protein